MKKKILSMLLCAAMSVSLLAACGDSSSAGSSSSAGASGAGSSSASGDLYLENAPEHR